MVRTGRLPSLLAVVAGVFVACGGQGAGCACMGFQQLPQGSYTGPKLDSAGAIRVSGQGFAYLNSDAGVSTVLALLAPGGTLRVPVSCTIQTTSLAGIPLLRLAIADEGELLCTSEACGYMDGVCDARDLPREVVITVNSLSFAPKAPDLVEAAISASVATGQLHIASTSANSCLLAGGGRIKCSVDFDTARNPPVTTNLALNIKLVIDTRWDRLLSLEVQDIGGAESCSSGRMPPACIDARDIILERPMGASCSLCTLGQFEPVKNLLIGQLANSLKKQLDKTLSELNCAPCTMAGQCPVSPQMGVTAMCQPEDGGPGKCVDAMTNKCVPRLLGLEGRVEVSTALQGLVARGSELELAFGAGGSVASSPQGTTIGLRGGLREVRPAPCVAPRNRPAPMMLPLPNFDADAPTTGYDVALSLSQQVMSDALYRVQQSGALCLELGSESVAQLESGVLATLLPSLALYTENKSVPLRVVVRPVNPPTVVVGEGTLDMNGQPRDPLLLLDWPQLELDVYALVEERYTRLFTIQADLKLPFALDVQGCDQLRPVVGNLMNAIQNVSVKNNELLAESPAALTNLVPSLLSLVEPQLARGLPSFALPDLQGFPFRVKLVRARGVGQITGTSTYNHLGLYARLYPREEACPASLVAEEAALWLTSRDGAIARITGLGTQEVSFRVDDGFWSTWRLPDSFGQAIIEHPRLTLPGAHVVEVRGADGRVGRVELR